MNSTIHINYYLDYKLSLSIRAYMVYTISHAAKPSVENARKLAIMRSSVKSAYDELLKLDHAVTALGNQLYAYGGPNIKTGNNATAAALDSKHKNIRATAMHKIEQWKVKHKAFQSLLNEYKKLNPSDANMRYYESYAKDTDAPHEISKNAYENLIGPLPKL